MPDDPGEYRLSDEPPPKRRHVPLPKPPELEEDDEDREPESLLARVMADDPFPWLIGASILVWVGLGLASQKWPLVGIVLVLCGLVICVLGQIYLFASIYLESPKDALLSFVFGWYRQFYLFQNPELTLKPMLLSGVGLGMVLTGLFLPNYRKQHAAVHEPRYEMSAGSMPS